MRSKSKSRSGIGVLSREDGERVESPEGWLKSLMNTLVQYLGWRMWGVFPRRVVDRELGFVRFDCVEGKG